MTQRKLEEIKLKHVRNNLEIYKNNSEMISMYDEYITKIAELFDFVMEKDSNLFYTIVFSILVEIGFFSADRNFEPDEDKYGELIIRPGLNVVCGAGVCRNVACFYEDVFSYFYNYPLKLCCLDKNATMTDDTKRYGNHMINLTFYKDTLYGYDVLNECLFKAKDFDLLEGLEVNYPLEYTPNGDLLVELITALDEKSNFYNEVQTKYKLLEIASTRDILSVDEYIKLTNDANEFIKARKRLLQSFLVKNEELTHEIKKKMLSIK